MDLQARVAALVRIGVSRRRIATRAGVPAPTLHHFLHGRDIYLSTALKLDTAICALEREHRKALKAARVA
jgi:predicted transcriptional regulator